jgi:hypothetical protein
VSGPALSAASVQLLTRTGTGAGNTLTDSLDRLASTIDRFVVSLRVRSTRSTARLITIGNSRDLRTERLVVALVHNSVC